MKDSLRNVFLFFLLVFISLTGHKIFAQQNAYPDPSDLERSIKDLHLLNPAVTEVHKLAESPGKNAVLMLEIGNEINSTQKNIPAIFVVGNLDGNRPIASMAALNLARDILDDENKFENHTWYIIPAGNPDAYYRYFTSPRYEDQRDGLPHNDDMDEQTDEDGYNDLNGDGYITKMRVIHPEGEWIIVNDEPRLMRKARPEKGEKGIYKVFTEGLDDDGDGKFNEDGPGGTNVNINFPHLFRFFTDEGGLYPGSSPEARAIIEFVFEHPEIAMTFSFGATNFCLSPPKGGRKGDVDLNAIKIPERYAGMLGADPEKTYSMKEIIEMVQPLAPQGVTVDESMLATFLGLGAVVNPLDDDLTFYNKLKEDYKKYLESKSADNERFEPEKAKDGSFELWSYYHLGVPVFSMDLWEVSKTETKEKEGSGLDLDELENMSSDKFLALGEEKISAFLKESGVPEQYTARSIMEMVESEKTDPAKMAEMIKQMPEKEAEEEGGDPKEKALLEYSDKILKGKGFVNWEKYDHPELGEVEIGGFVPFIETTPDYAVADSIIGLHIPWIYEIVKELPSLNIHEFKLTDEGAGVYKLDLWIENKSYLPFPTAMGKRNRQPAPAVILLSGENHQLLSGYSRTVVGDLGGSSRKKLSWLIKADKKAEILINLKSRAAGNDQKIIKIGG